MPDSGLADGAVLTSAFYDDYIREQVVTTCTTATRPTPVEGKVIFEADTHKLRVYDGTQWVDLINTYRWDDYTAEVQQPSTVASIDLGSAYLRMGRLIQWTANLRIAAAGTGGNGVRLKLPVTPSSPGAGCMVGGGYGYVYNGSAYTPVFFDIQNGSQYAYVNGTATSATAITYTTALAAGHYVRAWGFYEAASDA